MSEGEKWILGCTIVMAICTLAAVVISIIAVNKKQEVKVEQPVSITITEELHKSFASKEAFEKHVQDMKGEIDRLDEILRVEIPEMERRITSAADQRVRRLHQRIDPLYSGVAALCSKAGVRMQSPISSEE